MKRDMGLIRQIAFDVEAKAHGFDQGINSTAITIEGYSPHQIAFHCELMHEADLIKTLNVGHMHSEHAEFMIYRLTWKGCDFLDAAREDKVWFATMRRISTRLASVSFDVLISILTQESRILLGLES